MAKSPTEQIRELEKDHIAARAIIDAAQRELVEQRAVNRAWESRAGELQKENVDLRRELAELRQEQALTRQRLDDHLKRVESWDARRWGFITAIAVAVFAASTSLASGIIIASLRK